MGGAYTGWGQALPLPSRSLRRFAQARRGARGACPGKGESGFATRKLCGAEPVRLWSQLPHFENRHSELRDGPELRRPDIVIGGVCV